MLFFFSKVLFSRLSQHDSHSSSSSSSPSMFYTLSPSSCLLLLFPIMRVFACYYLTPQHRSTVKTLYLCYWLNNIDAKWENKPGCDQAKGWTFSWGSTCKLRQRKWNFSQSARLTLETTEDPHPVRKLLQEVWGNGLNSLCHIIGVCKLLPNCSRKCLCKDLTGKKPANLQVSITDGGCVHVVNA